MQTLKEAVEQERNVMAVYDRVHAEIAAGKPWSEIDNGTGRLGMSYDGWLAYMQQRFTNKLRSLIAIAANE
jgi:hypothetical protein